MSAPVQIIEQRAYTAPGFPRKRNRRRTPIQDRFWPKVRKTADCWEWTGCRAPNGYGKIAKGGQFDGPISAHRLSYQIHFGPIPEGALVCHRCDNRGCVRPDHLFLGSHHDNNHDMLRKGRAAWQTGTHCRNGHEYTPQNTGRHFGKRTGRRCLTCSHASAAAKLLREKEARKLVGCCPSRSMAEEVAAGAVS